MAPRLGAVQRGINQDIGRDIMHAPGKAQPIGDACHFRQGKGGNAGTEQHGRHGDMQPIETARREKARDGEPAAFDKNPAGPTRLERSKQGRDGETPASAP